jgi:hypothetical protein
MRKAFAGAVLSVAAVVLLTATPAGAKTYKPGQTATTSDIKVKVYGVQEPYTPSNQFVTANPGQHFVAVDMELTNKTSEQKTFSTLVGLHLIDGSNHQYDEDISGAATISPKVPDGQLPSKQPLRGFACFQVPDSSVKLKLRVQGSITAEGSVFQLTSKTGQPIPAVTRPAAK